MSGPKLSEAELERLRQEQLERERQEALRRMRHAQQAYREACNRLGATKRYSQSVLDQINVMYRGDAQKEAAAFLAMLKQHPVMDEKDYESYLEAADSINKDIEQVVPKLEKCLGKYLSRCKTDQQLSDSDSLHQSFQSFISLQKDPVDVTNIDFKGDFESAQLLEKLSKILLHYKWLAGHTKSDALRKFASKSMVGIQTMLNDPKAMSTADALNRVQAMLNQEADIKRREAEMQSLYDDYVALATLVDLIPKPPTDYADVQVLKKDIADLHHRLRKKDEMDYIADQINDAMISLGYGFVTSRVLMRKDQSEMDCSLYQADDRTGIAVYTDQTGGVMMRMTVLGDDDDITEDDRDFSLQRQIDFCAGHADIVEALRERGVYLKQVSYLEPDKKHTYKVNMNAMGSTAQKDANGQTILKKQKVDRRKRRRASKKKMRAM